MSDSSTSYDILEYKSLPRRETHPSRINAIAHLFGLPVANLGTARILELGCASGGNIIPLAVSMPDARFEGIDLSSRQIASGQSIISLLKLRNVELEHRSILDFQPAEGVYDYIICHGVYSWVPPEVRSRILEICRRGLTETGFAYISYNALPGWHMQYQVRDLMRYHAGQQADPTKAVEAGKSFLNILSAHRPGGEAWDAHLRSSNSSIRTQSHNYLFHEYFESENRAFYLNEFCSDLAAHALSYLGDAHYSLMCAADVPPEFEMWIRTHAPDRIAYEQYLDFFRNRQFRESIVCRAEAPLAREVQRERLKNLFVSSPLQPVTSSTSADDLRSGKEEIFRLLRGGEARSSDPTIRASLRVLANIWPERITFSELHAEARRLTGETIDSSSSEKNLLENLQVCFEGNLVEVDSMPSVCTSRVSETPRATALARYQASKGMLPVSLRHEAVKLDPFGLQCLVRLNGQRSRSDLITEFRNLAATGAFQIEKDGRPVKPEELVALVPDLVDRALNRLAREGFFLL